MAAQVLAEAGHSVLLVDRMRSPGRKLLLAGRGGLNLTHTEALGVFVGRYGPAADRLRPVIEAFDPAALRAWAAALGQPTFVGTSGRVFPESMRATPLLRSWLAHLADLGVQLRTGTPLRGWADDGSVLVGDDRVRPRATLLALGGASWPGTGSDGGWVPLLRARGVDVHDLRPANSAFLVDWSPLIRERFAGTPLKNIALTAGGRTVRGEAMISAQGIEGGAVYALSSVLRDLVDRDGGAELLIDLRADLSVEKLADRLARRGGGQSLSSVLRKAGGLETVGVALMRETRRGLPDDPATLAALVKAVPVRLTGVGDIGRAISSAGGIAWSEVAPTFMLRRVPGTFVAGEMIDWEAPTGGYLLQATLATAVAAANGMRAWIGRS